MEVNLAETSIPNFQVPSEMRACAEQSVEQARKAFDSFFAAIQLAASSVEDYAAAAQAGAKEVQRKAVGDVERNIATSFEFAQKLLNAKDPQEVMRLHSDHMRSQIAALTEQARELGRTATAAAKSSKPAA